MGLVGRGHIGESHILLSHSIDITACSGHHYWGYIMVIYLPKFGQHLARLDTIEGSVLDHMELWTCCIYTLSN